MKSKKIILVSHCVLNQNSVIEGWARAKGAFPIANILLNNCIGILQLPCPELIFNGINRPPLEYEDYNTENYRNLCNELLTPYINQLNEYIKNGYNIIGVIGINNSPTCSISGQRGVLMEELFNICKRESIHLPYTEIPEYYTENTYDIEVENKILKLITEN